MRWVQSRRKLAEDFVLMLDHLLGMCATATPGNNQKQGTGQPRNGWAWTPPLSLYPFPRWLHCLLRPISELYTCRLQIEAAIGVHVVLFPKR